MESNPAKYVSGQKVKFLDLPNDVIEQIVLFALGGDEAGKDEAGILLLNIGLTCKYVWEYIVEGRIIENYFPGIKEEWGGCRVPKESFYLIIKAVNGSCYDKEVLKFLEADECCGIDRFVIAHEIAKEKSFAKKQLALQIRNNIEKIIKSNKKNLLNQNLRQDIKFFDKVPLFSLCLIIRGLLELKNGEISVKFLDQITRKGYLKIEYLIPAYAIVKEDVKIKKFLHDQVVIIINGITQNIRKFEANGGKLRYYFEKRIKINSLLCSYKIDDNDVIRGPIGDILKELMKNGRIEKISY